MAVYTKNGYWMMKKNSKEQSLEEKMEALCRTGFAVWSGEKLSSTIPTIRVKGDKTISQLVIENRESPDDFDGLMVEVAMRNDKFTAEEVWEDVANAIVEVCAS